MKILVLNGPNLNLLGTREPEIYGYETLADIEAGMRTVHPDVEIEFLQSNSESELITRIGQTRGTYDGIIINPAALTHTSLGVYDASSLEGAGWGGGRLETNLACTRGVIGVSSLAAGARGRGELAGILVY